MKICLRIIRLGRYQYLRLGDLLCKATASRLTVIENECVGRLPISAIDNRWFG